jgi:hypothetical protein
MCTGRLEHFLHPGFLVADDAHVLSNGLFDWIAIETEGHICRSYMEFHQCLMRRYRMLTHMSLLTSQSILTTDTETRNVAKRSHMHPLTCSFW